MKIFKYKAISGIITTHRDVAQLGSALPWGGRGRAFKSRRSDHAAVAQWIEQAPPKR